MQLNYNQSFQPAVAGGLIYPFEENTILTYSNPTEQIQWGRGVVLHTFGGGGGGVPPSGLCRLPAAVGDAGNFLGVALRDTSSMNNYHEQYSAVAVLRRGQVAVQVEQNVTDLSTVFVRYAARSQVQTLTFSGATVTGNIISVNVDGFVVSVTFTIDNATTLAALATAIQARPRVLTALSDGASVITVTTQLNQQPISINSATVTGGASQPTITRAITSAGAMDDDRGNFRADADNSTAFAVTTAKYLTAANAGQIAIVDLNIPS